MSVDAPRRTRRRGLTDLQRRFVERYLIDPNATRAYVAAGGTATTKKSVFAQACKLVGNGKVWAAIEKAQEARARRMNLSADKVVRQIVKVYKRCMSKTPVYDSQGQETGVWKFDVAGALKALDMLAKHTGVYEKHNRQKYSDPEVAKARLKEAGIDVDLLMKLPGVN